MKTKIFFIFLLAVITSHSNAAPFQKEIRITNFHTLCITGNVKIFLSQGIGFAAIMEGDQKAMKGISIG